MRSSGNGPFGVLLLAAPLVAVPLLAIFGIPQFAPGVDAGSTTEQSEFGFEEETAETRPSKSRRRSSADDLFGPLGETTSDELSDSELSSDDLTSGSDSWAPPAEALKGYRMAPPEEQFADASSSEEWFEESEKLEREQGEEGAGEFDRDEARQGLKDRDLAREDEDYDRPKRKRPSAPETLPDVNPPRELPLESEEPRGGSRVDLAKFETEAGPRRKGGEESFVIEEFSWRQASRRLRELGDNVKHYFDYDIEKETFIFHCELSPLDDPGVVQEFQAQGHEPLTTVREVIKQVERWSKNRQSNLARTEKQSSSSRSH